MKQLITLITLLIISVALHAQVYQTKNGVITLSGTYQGNTVTAVSRQLHMNLNYDRAEINMHLSVPLLITENDTLNKLLAGMAGTTLSFHGTLNTNHVHTKPHPKIKQPVSGTITLNNVTRPFSYAATLEHFPAGNISCVLTGNFTLDLLSFGIPALPGENKVAVSFKELLLKKINDQ